VLLANEALKLSAWERAQIIDALWRSPDPVEQASIDQAWLAESHGRLCAKSRPACVHDLSVPSSCRARGKRGCQVL
jgi:hypothetical protein